MRYRKVKTALLAQGCKWAPGKGDHEKWYCPCGEHMAVVTAGGTVSPGVVADTCRKGGCSEL